MSSVDFSEAKIETTHAAAPEETLGFEDVNSLILGSQALLECLLKGQDEHFDLWGEALEALIDKGEKLTPFNQMCHLLHDWKDRPYKNDFKKMLAAEILPLAAPCFEEDPTQTLSGLIKGFAWARHMGISALWIDKILDLTTPSSSTDPQATFVACCAALAWSEKDSAREIRATKFFNAATDRLFARFPHEAFGLLCQELRQASNHLRLKPAMEEKFLFYASAAAKDSPLKALQTMVQESQHLSPSDFFNLFEARFIATG
ncbi:MAG: hypothetical protein HGA90_00550, partial [Alphaproteobacteria bacterium]|nr:hypothetical protein [Alphaproteobacteria bacterium]